MPQNEKDTSRKKTAAKTTATSAVKKTGSASAKKRPAKKQGTRGSAGAGKKRTSHKRRKKKNQTPWWSWPVTVFMLVILSSVGLIVAKEMRDYRDFNIMRETVSFDGFYPGITIDGVDVSGRSLEEVLSSLKAHEDDLEQQVSLTLACGNQTWNITPDDLDYHSDYENVVRTAYQMGREGTLRQKYEAIKQLSASGTSLSISRGYDASLLRMITDQVADELSDAVVNATVAGFDVSTRRFTFTDDRDGSYVDAEQLYQNALATLQSGVGGQTLVITKQAAQADVTRSELESIMGEITVARTSTDHSTKNRLTNISLALNSLNGLCLQPGETFSFNDTVGQRTEARGYKKAGAFADGLLTEELGGGICQVSTTLFNAVAKADLEIVERQPHSRPVGYVDKGKDATVSWPGQDFKFSNNTDYPIYIVAELDEEEERCLIYVYGRKLENGMSIVIEAEVTEVLEPEEDRYIYTTDLATGRKELVEEARQGFRAVAYKIYLDANGKEIRREELCRSKYAAAGATYRVGQ